MTTRRIPADAGVAQRRSLAALMSEQELAEERRGYLARLRGHAPALARLRAGRRGAAAPPAALDELRTIAHKLAGSAALFGFEQLGGAAAALEDSIIERQSDRGDPGRVESELDVLLGRVARAQENACVA